MNIKMCIMNDDLDEVENKVNTKRITRLAWAELFDAWRVFPRFLVIMYMVMVAYVIKWFFSVPTYNKVECDATILEKLLQANIPLEKAQLLACHTIDIIGGPATNHTILVTTICGLAAAVFGLYTSSGREWAKGALPWNFRNTKKDEKEVEEIHTDSSDKTSDK